MSPTLWLFFGPRRYDGQKNRSQRRMWALLVSDSGQRDMKGIRLALKPSEGTYGSTTEVVEGYDLNDIPPGDEGVSGRVALGRLVSPLSGQELEKELQNFRPLFDWTSITQSRRLWCILAVKYL